MKPGSSIYITDRKFLLINSKHSQSALEYMMTYGWAILIIVIVAAVLYSLGIFNPTSSIPKATVTGFAGLGSVSAFCTSNGVLRIQIGNSLGVPIEITQLNGTDSDTGQTATFTPNSTVDPNPIIQPDSSYAFSLSDVCPSAGSSYSIASSFEYTEIGQTFPGPYFSTGTLSGSSASVAVPAFVASFNGNNYANTSSGYGVTTALTFSSWVLSSQNNSAIAYGNDEWFFGSGNPIDCCELRLGWLWDFRPFFDPGSHHDISPNTAVTTSKWNNLILSLQASGSSTLYTLFIDGVNVTHGGVSYGINSTSNLYVGDVNEPGMIGLESDVQIYNAVFSAADASELYAAGIGSGPLSGLSLLMWWPLNSTGKDFSGNGHNFGSMIYTSDYQSP